MTAFAHVGREDFLRLQLDIFIGHERRDGVKTLNNGDGTFTTIMPDDQATMPRPTVRLHEDEARALLQELIRHFDGGEDTRSLRRDYDAERARVDRLLGFLIGGATAS